MMLSCPRQQWLLFIFLTLYGNSLFGNHSVSTSAVCSPFIIESGCPTAFVNILDPGIVCTADDPFQLNVKVTGLFGGYEIRWYGSGVSDSTGWFEPAQAVVSQTVVHVIIRQGICTWSDSLRIWLVMNPVASFELTGMPCVDSALTLQWTGYAFGTSDWQWNFDEASVLYSPPPFPWHVMELTWSQPGSYTPGIFLDYYGCHSDSFVYPIEIGIYLDTPEVRCALLDYNTIEIAWEPMSGASEYVISSEFETTVTDQANYSLQFIPDNTEVQFEIYAQGPMACNVSPTAIISCATLDYIEPQFFIPNVFSPNHDGLNDRFFIQANSPVKTIQSFQVFDRWGNMVFGVSNVSPNEASLGWDGKFRGQPVHPGVYAYRAELATIYGTIILETGDVTLIR